MGIVEGFRGLVMSAAWPFLESGRYGEGAGLREKDRIVLGKPRGSGRHLMLQMPPAQPPPSPASFNLGSGLWVMNPEVFSMWVFSGWQGFLLL